MRHPYKLSTAAAVVILCGCAVTQKEVETTTQKKVVVSEQKLEQAATQQRQERRMTVVPGNFIGDVPIEIPYASTLPEVFFKTLSIQSRGGAFGTVTEAARNLSLASGMPVLINPDVEGAATSAGASRNTVRMAYAGTLLGYVREIANSGGVEWELHDGAIHFYRLITKSFSLSNVSPGDIDVADSMAKGGQAATGQTGGANAGTTGSFSSTSQVGLRGTYSMWRSLKPALDAALTTSGKISINEGTATITVTDTKEAVARVGKLIDAENNILGKQVLVEVRVLRVDLNKQSQAGVNLNAVYSVLKGGAATRLLETASQSTQVSGAAGAITFSVLDPAASTGGTSFGIQALNQFGNIISDSTYSLITTNRVPAMTGSFATRGFLASTTPAAGGAAGASAGGGSGVPGLTPGSTTTGSFLRVLPTIKENNSVLVSMSVDISDLLGLGSASTGSGATLQQIQWANTAGTKTISSLLVNQGESMVMAGIDGEGVTSSADNSVAGASAAAQKTKSLFVLIVTPRILKSM